MHGDGRWRTGAEGVRRKQAGRDRHDLKRAGRDRAVAAGDGDGGRAIGGARRNLIIDLARRDEEERREARGSIEVRHLHRSSAQ